MDVKFVIKGVLLDNMDYSGIIDTDKVIDQILALPELEEYFKEKLRKKGWKSQDEMKNECDMCVKENDQ